MHFFTFFLTLCPNSRLAYNIRLDTHGFALAPIMGRRIFPEPNLKSVLFQRHFLFGLTLPVFIVASRRVFCLSVSFRPSNSKRFSRMPLVRSDRRHGMV